MAGAEGQYYCWGCHLMFGESDAPMLPSQLCPSCKRTPPLDREYTPDDDATGVK